MKFYIHKFPNCLRSLVIHDNDSSSVSVLIMVRVGSRFERAKVGGIAHFVEHTIFKGTLKRPSSRKISMEVEKLGASMNAFTSYDYTGYYIKSPKESFEKAIEVLADIFLNSVFDEKEIEKERGVIIEEKRMYEDKPMDKVVDVFMANLFKKHALGREIIGTEDSINNIKRQDFLNFLEEYYGGKNTIVVVAGGIDSKRANLSIKKLFCVLEKKKFSSFSKFNKFSIKNKVINIRKPIAQSHLVIGGFGMKRQSKDRFIAQVGEAILGYGFGSRLFQTIRDKLGLAYYVYLNHTKFEETGTYYIGLGVENTKINQAICAVLDQLKKIAKGNFTKEELERAKSYIIGGLTVGLESSTDLASWYGSQLLLNEEVLSVEQVQKQIKKTTTDDVVRVWSKLIRNDNLLLAGVTPHKKLNVVLSF